MVGARTHEACSPAASRLPTDPPRHVPSFLLLRLLRLWMHLPVVHPQMGLAGYKLYAAIVDNSVRADEFRVRCWDNSFFVPESWADHRHVVVRD